MVLCTLIIIIKASIWFTMNRYLVLSTTLGLLQCDRILHPAATGSLTATFKVNHTSLDNFSECRISNRASDNQRILRVIRRPSFVPPPSDVQPNRAPNPPICGSSIDRLLRNTSQDTALCRRSSNVSRDRAHPIITAARPRAAQRRRAPGRRL